MTIFYTDISGAQVEPELRQYICATPDSLYLRTPDGDERAVQMHWLAPYEPPESYKLFDPSKPAPQGCGIHERAPWA